MKKLTKKQKQEILDKQALLLKEWQEKESRIQKKLESIFRKENVSLIAMQTPVKCECGKDIRIQGNVSLQLVPTEYYEKAMEEQKMIQISEDLTGETKGDEIK